MEGAIVRRFGERDIDAAIALTNLENWGFTHADFARLLALSPDGCFAAELDGRVVGVLTTTRYDGLAFLGAVIVRPELRGKGLGEAMMTTALDHLRRVGVRTVGLYAYLNVVRFYERLGFRGEYEIIRWHGSAEPGNVRGVRPVRMDDLGPLAVMDAKYFGTNRRILLDRLVEEFPSTFLIAERRGRIRGYIVGNPNGDSCEIGPWVVDPAAEGTAEDLYESLIAAAGVSEVAFSGPSPNESLLEFVRGRRLEEAFRTLRMVWGSDEFREEAHGIWGVGGLEKG